MASQADTAELLADHLRLVQEPLRTTLPAVAVRTSSIEARHLLVRAALGDAAGLPDLLVAARAGDTRWLRRLRRRVHPDLLAGLAQTLALQDLLATDRRDALALYALIRGALGAGALGPGHQGLHAQLAFVTDGPAAARALLRHSSLIRPRIRAELRVDLLNPFAGGRGQPVEPWLAAFRALLPVPGIGLGAETGGAPFDRLTTDPVDRVDGAHRISVVVTAYRPDEGLITAVRSIVAQSWHNTEVIVVDDGSPAHYTPLLERCRTLGGRVRLIRLAANVGTYAARNAGLDASEGEFVAFQDSDDWSHPRRLEWQVRALLDDPRLVASTADGLAVTGDLLLTRPNLRGEGFNPSSLLFRRDAVMRRVGYFDRVRKGADSEYLGRIRAAFGERRTHHVETGPLALIRLSANSLSRSEVRPFWLHPARAAYCSAYHDWHERIAVGAAPAYRPADGADRPFAAPAHLRTTAAAHPSGETYDVVMVADWRFLDGTHLAALDELRALAGAGLRVGVAHLESYRLVARRRLPLARPVQHLINTSVVDHVPLGEARDVALVVVRQAAVLQFPGDGPCELRPHRVLVVADRAPSRLDGTDRRYLPDACTRTARRMFGVDPLWCPQDGGVRAALGGLLPAEALTAFDLPQIVDAGGWAASRVGASAAQPVVGTDLCDSGSWPADIGDALAVFRGLTAYPEKAADPGRAAYPGMVGADVRIRLSDRPGRGARLSMSWLVYAAADLDTRSFAHQLDLYLHFPGPQAAETFSRPALEAAAAGVVVVMPPSFAATHGDTAVYGTPGQLPELVARYHRDRALFVAQSDRARDAVSLRHHPRSFLERITTLGARAAPPAPRGPRDRRRSDPVSRVCDASHPRRPVTAATPPRYRWCGRSRRPPWCGAVGTAAARNRQRVTRHGGRT